jgi:hypothetical protein
VRPDKPYALRGRLGGVELERLQAALRAHARGLCCAEAAVELLIGHRVWLRRRDFTAVFVETGVVVAGGVPAASIGWPAAIDALDAGALPGSGGEQRVLRIGASLSAGILLDLGGAVTGLDETNIGLVAQAIRHANGHRPVGL